MFNACSIVKETLLAISVRFNACERYGTGLTELFSIGIESGFVD